MTHQPTPSGIRAGARPPSCYGVMLAAKCGRASGLVRAAAPALTARAPGHIAPALVPRRLMVRLRFLIPPIEVRILAGHPFPCHIPPETAHSFKLSGILGFWRRVAGAKCPQSESGRSASLLISAVPARSVERRVGKECVSK